MTITKQAVNRRKVAVKPSVPITLKTSPHILDSIIGDFDNPSELEVESALDYSSEQLDGCCAFLVISGLNSYGSGRKALAKAALNLQEDASGYTSILATTITAQRAEIAILKKLGFESVFSETNKRTGNKITFWKYKL